MDSRISNVLTADPGLPSPQSSESYWLRPASALSQARSCILPETRDIVVIGSGVTAASLIRTLLEGNPKCTVSVLEARTLCSGATGRNGGHLVTYGGLIYADLKRTFGKEAAIEVMEFTFENIKRTKELIAEFGSNAQYRDVTRYRSFEDEATFESAKQSLIEFERDMPSMVGMYKILTGEDAKAQGIHDVRGTIVFDAGALWPYRLITEIFENLSVRYGERLTLETTTPALEIQHDAAASSHPYSVRTPRGTIRASHVVHCTNGYTGHLLPKLRGPLFPVRGSMTVQDLNGKVANRGKDTSWSLHHIDRHDPSTGLTEVGTFYLQQNHLSGHFFFGGEKPDLAGAFTADDSIVDWVSVNFLKEKLSKLFGLNPRDQGHLVSAWTGIMGYTADGLPLVGRLEEPTTNRSGEGEWIAAGFNGMGMSMCVLSGERLAKNILGNQSASSIPSAFQVTLKRLERTLTIENSIRDVEETFPSLARKTDAAKTYARL